MTSIEMVRPSILCFLKTIIGIFATTFIIFSAFISVLDSYTTLFPNIPNRFALIERTLTQTTTEITAQTTPTKKIMKRFIPLKDWNDDQAYKEALGRRGLGELGQPARLKNVDKKLEEKLSREYGYNAMLSDRISLNRSVPDIRHVR